MFTKGATLDDGTEIQFVVNDIPEGLRLAFVLARKNPDGTPKEAHLFHITVTDAAELEAIGVEVESVDARLHPENWEDEDDDEDDSEDEADDEDDGDDDDGDDDDGDDEDDGGDDDDDDGDLLPEELDEPTRDRSEEWKRGVARDRRKR